MKPKKAGGVVRRKELSRREINVTNAKFKPLVSRKKKKKAL